MENIMYKVVVILAAGVAIAGAATVGKGVYDKRHQVEPIKKATPAPRYSEYQMYRKRQAFFSECLTAQSEDICRSIWMAKLRAMEK